MAVPELRFADLLALVHQRAPDADPAALLEAAVAVSAAQAADADRLLDHFVSHARTSGLSWTDIGTRLGVTKQAARQRFAAPSPEARTALTGQQSPASAAATRPARWWKRRPPVASECSFCGGNSTAVGPLVNGPGVTICQPCVNLCQEILDRRSVKSI